MCVRKATGLSEWQLRQFTMSELVGPVQRTEGGHRVWSKRQVELLKQVAAWRRMGMQVREIRVLLQRDRSALAKHLVRRRAELEGLIAVVDALERAAEEADRPSDELAAGCSGGTRPAPAAVLSRAVGVW